MEEFKWIEGWGMSTFDPEKAFLAKYNIPPNKFTYSLGDAEFDYGNVDLAVLREKYPNAIFKLTTQRSDVSTSSVDDASEVDFVPVSGSDGNILYRIEDLGETLGGGLTILDENCFYDLGTCTIKIYYSEGINAEEKCTELLNTMPYVKNEIEKGEVQLVGFNQGYYTVTSKINPTTIDVKKNYNDDFEQVHKDTVEFLKSRESGVVLLYGRVGSGKTSYVRHLITNVPMEYIIVPSNVAENMMSPDFTSFLLDNRNSCFILEDCEQLLKSRDENAFGGAVASLLNMADGLMSDIYNIKFICTFNADINAIDKALLRKGRCYARYEFGELCEEKTKILLNERGIELDSYEPMTLANIYNYHSTDYAVKEKHSIGF